MPHTDSAKKRLRQNEKRRAQNRAVKSDLRTHMKKLLKAVKEQDAAGAESQFRIVQKKLDKCAMRRYLHPNTAYRYKSRLARRIGKITAPGAPTEK